jgi:hypothetical protein
MATSDSSIRQFQVEVSEAEQPDLFSAEMRAAFRTLR